MEDDLKVMIHPQAVVTHLVSILVLMEDDLKATLAVEFHGPGMFQSLF